MQMIGYDRLRVEGPCKLKHITDVAMSWKPGEHGMLRISGMVEEELRTNATLEAVWQDKIALYDEEEGKRKPLFKGVVTSVQTVHRNGVYTVEIEAVSGSIYSDLKKRRRSFQDTSQTYEKIITTVLRAYPGGDVLLQKGEKEKPSEPVIQYEETDWELTKRLASQFQSVVVCDILEETPKLFIGMPEGKEHKLPDGASYTVSKDLAAFQKAGGEAAGLHDTDFFGYEIESRMFYRLGDRFKIRGYIELIVSSMTARLEKGQLIYDYRLLREAGIREQPMMNRRLSGLTLQGEILAVKGEQVQVHLGIDDKQDKGTAHWYRYAPETGSAMYSMPQVGTKANLYLADAGGQEAIVTGGVRTNGASAEKTADPNNRYFGTEHGSEMKLSPTGVEFTGGSKEPLFLKLDDAVGIILSSPRKLTLTAKEEISLFTPKRVVIGAQALLVAKKTSAPSGITLEGEYNLMGAQIRTEGKDRTSYAPYDDAPVEGEPPPPPPPPEKPPFSWGKLARNVLAGLAVVAVVAVAAAFTVATLGAGAVVVGAVLAGAAIAGTAAVVSQAVSDIARGEVSDMGTYVSTASRESVIGAISGAVFGPFGPMANLGGRMAFGAVQNGFESVIRQTMEGKGFSFGTLALDMGIGGLTGGIMDSRLTKAIGDKIANAKIVQSVGKKVFEVTNELGDRLSRTMNDLTDWIGSSAATIRKNLLSDALKDGVTSRLKKLQNILTLKNLDENWLRKVQTGILDLFPYRRVAMQMPSGTTVYVIVKREAKPQVSKIDTGNSGVIKQISRIDEVKIDFKRNPKHDKDEFERQLKAQEEGLNSLTVDEFIKNRDNYLKNGRAPEGDAAQKAAREKAYLDKVAELRREGMSKEDAQKKASKWIEGQAALHNPDQIAGGNPDHVSGMGDRRINSSLGAQWKYRADELDKQVRLAAANMTDEEKKNTLLNIKLLN